MNKKEIAEIRRRLQHDRHRIATLRGCYVGRDGSIITSFSKAFPSLNQEDEEKYLGVFRRTLSGEIGQNLLDLDFPASGVAVSAQHRLLSALRADGISDETRVQELFEHIISSVHMEDQYLILLVSDEYDVPHGQNGESGYLSAGEVFRYILCALCPVQPTKPALCYSSEGRDFRSREPEFQVGAPALGFMFPAFDDRSSNIYGALMYTRDTGEANEGFVDAVFGVEPQMSADSQREIFSLILESALQEECTLEAVQGVQDMVLSRKEEAKRENDSSTLMFSARDVAQALESSGVSEDKARGFEKQYEANLGEGTVLCGANVAPTRQFTVKTPSVSIRVLPDRADLVETRVIDGHNYILIRADEDVTVNGVSVKLLGGEN